MTNCSSLFFIFLAWFPTQALFFSNSGGSSSTLYSLIPKSDYIFYTFFKHWLLELYVQLSHKIPRRFWVLSCDDLYLLQLASQFNMFDRIPMMLLCCSKKLITFTHLFSQNWPPVLLWSSQHSREKIYDTLSLGLVGMQYPSKLYILHILQV